jgi:hypothetical protein
MVFACTSHWIELHPPPDVDAWAALADPDERLGIALSELYAYYRETHAMWTTSHRDAALVEPLDAILDGNWLALLDHAPGSSRHAVLGWAHVADERRIASPGPAAARRCGGARAPRRARLGGHGWIGARGLLGGDARAAGHPASVRDDRVRRVMGADGVQHRACSRCRTGRSAIGRAGRDGRSARMGRRGGGVRGSIAAVHAGARDRRADRRSLPAGARRRVRHCGGDRAARAQPWIACRGGVRVGRRRAGGARGRAGGGRAADRADQLAGDLRAAGSGRVRRRSGGAAARGSGGAWVGRRAEAGARAGARAGVGGIDRGAVPARDHAHRGLGSLPAGGGADRLGDAGRDGGRGGAYPAVGGERPRHGGWCRRARGRARGAGAASGRRAGLDAGASDADRRRDRARAAGAHRASAGRRGSRGPPCGRHYRRAARRDRAGAAAAHAALHRRAGRPAAGCGAFRHGADPRCRALAADQARPRRGDRRAHRPRRRPASRPRAGVPRGHAAARGPSRVRGAAAAAGRRGRQGSDSRLQRRLPGRGRAGAARRRPDRAPAPAAQRPGRGRGRGFRRPRGRVPRARRRRLPAARAGGPVPGETGRAAASERPDHGADRAVRARRRRLPSPGDARGAGPRAGKRGSAGRVRRAAPHRHGGDGSGGAKRPRSLHRRRSPDGRDLVAGGGAARRRRWRPAGADSHRRAAERPRPSRSRFPAGAPSGGWRTRP